MATSKESASPLTEIPDHLLAEIFLRLPAPADLARASAACVSFRRIVTDGFFLRSFRRLHAPPLLGFLGRRGFHPALPPHPSAPGAAALALAADFSFSFLPSHCRWAVQDIRDGRVLLHRQPDKDEQLPRFTELVVCDPVRRRYVLLPMVRGSQCRPFLVPSGEAQAAAMEETSFKVISVVVHCQVDLTAYVFSSSTGQWTAAASKSWNDLARRKSETDVMSKMHHFFLRRHYVYGCFYWDWLLIGSRKLLVLDTRRMEFSMADLPPGDWSARGVAIVESGDGRLGKFAFHCGTPSYLRYTIVRDRSERPSHWQMERTISLDSGYKYDIRDATERYLLLTARSKASSLQNPLTEYLSIDIKTLKIQRVCLRRLYVSGPHIYQLPTIVVVFAANMKC